MLRQLLTFIEIVTFYKEIVKACNCTDDCNCNIIIIKIDDLNLLSNCNN